MKNLDSLDLFSYQCGVIDAFNEVVKACLLYTSKSGHLDSQ